MKGFGFSFTLVTFQELSLCLVVHWRWDSHLACRWILLSRLILFVGSAGDKTHSLTFARQKLSHCTSSPALSRTALDLKLLDAKRYVNIKIIFFRECKRLNNEQKVWGIVIDKEKGSENREIIEENMCQLLTRYEVYIHKLKLWCWAFPILTG